MFPPQIFLWHSAKRLNVTLHPLKTWLVNYCSLICETWHCTQVLYSRIHYVYSSDWCVCVCLFVCEMKRERKRRKWTRKRGRERDNINFSSKLNVMKIIFDTRALLLPVMHRRAPYLHRVWVWVWVWVWVCVRMDWMKITFMYTQLPGKQSFTHHWFIRWVCKMLRCHWLFTTPLLYHSVQE